MTKTKIYIPIENLEVERKIKLGNIIIHPSNHLQTVISDFNKITLKTKNTEEQKKKFAIWYENDLKNNLGKYAFAELYWQNDAENNLIPKDLDSVYEKAKEVLSILYLLQKQIAGVSSIEHQKFGLSNELHRSLNCLVAIQGKTRSTYNLQRGGVLADWTFVNREINKFTTNSIYKYFNLLLKKPLKTEMEKRILSSAIWFYDAALDFTPTGRFIKLIISLEVLFASDKDLKSFRLSRFSTLLSHLYILDNWQCLCPILDSHTYDEYVRRIRELNLPGICSAFWDMRKWYKIRSSIVHDANRTIDKKDISSLEWWSHKLIIATIDIVAEREITTLDAFERFLESEYRKRKTTW